MTPPRAGTFIYHAHMDETDQLATGMYGAMLVLEPGGRFDPARDHLFVIGEAVDGGERTLAINGRREPPSVTLAAGAAHRVRIIDVNPDLTTDVTLVPGSSALRWVSFAHDGAACHPRCALKVRRGSGWARARPTISSGHPPSRATPSSWCTSRSRRNQASSCSGGRCGFDERPGRRSRRVAGHPVVQRRRAPAARGAC
jgi:hypothetical protein